MNASRLKSAAVALLAVAVVAIAASMHATLRAGAIHGPGALVVTAGNELWLAVDEELWRIGADGRLRDRRGIASTGLSGAPSSLVRHPGGAIVATVRNDAALHFIDPQSLRVTRSLLPRWPHDLERHSGRAINVAFDDAGRIAIATGGGHAVRRRRRFRRAHGARRFRVHERALVGRR